MYGAAGLSRRIFSKRKRHLGAVWGILLQQHLQSPLHWAAQSARRGVGGIKPKYQAPGRVHTSEGRQEHIQGIRESAHHRRPCVHIHNPEEGECLNLWVQGLLESWAGGCPSAGLEKRRAGLCPLSWLQPKRPAELACSVRSQQEAFSFLSNY